MKSIALIGGGATNLLLAALLSKHNVKVDIIEIRNRVGKKILETGNGKCNFTNTNITKDDYNHPDFVNEIIKYDVKEIFNSLGLLSYSDNEGRCYPCSDASNSILDLLRYKYLDNPLIHELVESEVTNIKRTNNKYILTINNNKYEYDYVVLGIGSKVNNNNFKQLNLDLNTITYNPSLCPILTKVSGLKGVRVKCLMTLKNKNLNIYQEQGEVIFKDNAISGIAIFNASFYINKLNLTKSTISLDLFPTLSIDDLKSFLMKKSNQTPSVFFIGITNKMVGQYFINKLNLKNKITKEDINSIAFTLKNLDFEVLGLMDAPQVAKGGIDIYEIKPNLELKKYSNIYIGGEMMDVDGKCGGYNLHFAFSSALTIYNNLKEIL